MKKGGYYCTQCQSKYCELPIDCEICGISLISSPHLARTYHHLFPVQEFENFMLKEGEEDESKCFSCLEPLKKNSFNCKSCGSSFCIDCDLFIHETLFNCPGCLNN